MTSWKMFCDVLQVDELTDEQVRMAENIIIWCTLFNDKKNLKERITLNYGVKYGGTLTTEQVTKIVNKGINFSEWGRLSRTFLDDLSVQTEDGYRTFMDIMREGDTEPGRVGRALNMNEILVHKEFDFQQAVDTWNRNFGLSRKLDIDDLPGSPSVRREVGQSIKIVQEIISIAKHEPSHIFVEVTRDADAKKKSKRTKSQHDRLADGIKNMRQIDPGLFDSIKDDFGACPKNDLSDALYLYFSQCGKCMYSGEPLRIEELSTYQIDHIIPQAYIKDDSLENRVLVKPQYNQRKSDSLLLSADIIKRQQGFWESLHNSHLIGDKKFNNLTRDKIDEKRMQGFIARQIVETSQSVKFVQKFLKQDYPKIDVVPIKAGISSALRKKCGFVKCREANNYHHAHDAFLACREGLFLKTYYPLFIDDPMSMTRIVKKYVAEQADEFRKYKRVPGDSGCIVGLFTQSRFDAETKKVVYGVISNPDTGKVLWDANEEISNMRKTLNLPDCYISRMPEETSGAFWDETVYSPVLNKKLQPLGKDLETNKYGGYSSEKYAYFFIYTARKKNKVVLQLKGVPLTVAKMVSTDVGGLTEYAKRFCYEQGLELIEVLIPKVLKYQKVIVDDNLFYVTGEVEVRNASEIAFGLPELELLDLVFNGFEIEEKNKILLYRRIVDVLTCNSPKLAYMLKLNVDDTVIENLQLVDYAHLLITLLRLANGTLNMGDMSAIDGPKCAGNIRVSWNSLAQNGSSIKLIEESVTGMFEKRTKIEI